MPVNYEYDPNLNIVQTRPYGELSTLEVGAYFKEVLNNGEVRTEFVEVVNFENVENFLFSSDEASTITRLYKELKDSKKVRATVFICMADMHFGIARMMQILFEINIPEHAVYAVRNEEEADKVIKKTIG